MLQFEFGWMVILKENELSKCIETRKEIHFHFFYFCPMTNIEKRVYKNSMW